MRLARGLERRLERLVDGLAARVFRGDLHPVELATRLAREADLAVVEHPAGPTIPNRYDVSLNISQADEPSLAMLGTEMAAAIAGTAADRGWRYEGPVQVDIVADRGVARGSLKCETAFRSGPLPAWAHLIEADGPRRLPLRHVRCLVGRGVDVDINLAESEISRHHALVWMEGGRVWITDLGSINGSRIDGALLREAAPVMAGSVLAFGPAAFSFHPE